MRKLKFDLGPSEPDPNRLDCHCEHVDELRKLKLDKVAHEWGLFRVLLGMALVGLLGIGVKVIGPSLQRVPSAPPPIHDGERLGIDRVERGRDGGSR